MDEKPAAAPTPDPIEAQFRELMNVLANNIDTIFNGEVENPEDRQVAFVLLICKVGDDARVNYISNAERRSVLAMMRKFLNRAEKGMV